MVFDIARALGGSGGDVGTSDKSPGEAMGISFDGMLSDWGLAPVPCAGGGGADLDVGLEAGLAGGARVGAGAAGAGAAGAGRLVGRAPEDSTESVPR